MEIPFQSYLEKIKLTVPLASADAVMKMHAEGATVPFMARYRKEKTGNLDEVQIQAVIDAHSTLAELNKRREFVSKEIEKQGNLTEQLKKRVEACWDLGDLEEIYRPFKKKKKTKAAMAREAGLQPLADWLWALGHGELRDDTTKEVKAKQFVNPAKKFVTYEEVLKGAQDIIVERLANDEGLREKVRDEYLNRGQVSSRVGKKYKTNSKYEMYKEFNEPVKTLRTSKASHRYLAMRRGWNENELVVTVSGNDEKLKKEFVEFALTARESQVAGLLKEAGENSLTMYVIPSVTNEVHRILKDQADGDAIRVFCENVRRVLMGSPFGAKCVLGIDPGLRTGCKVVLIDGKGNFISHTVIYTRNDEDKEKVKKLLSEVMNQITIDAIAVGNGTNGRETQNFIRQVIQDMEKEIPVILVNESGASVYSASTVAREEFPDLDVSVRGAISIARRLQDPLAELVKIDPKSIGVGQYQHDVPQPQLKKGLQTVVESCVNQVGVDVNTASPSLLSHVSGIGPAIAKNIVEHRQKNGLFKARDELQKVSRMTTKTFEQCAGFLRVANGGNILDSTGIHPERYSAVRDMVGELKCQISDLMGAGAKKLVESRGKWIQLVGEYTFDDIVKELEKPGRDPRDPYKVFQFREDIREVKDLKDGMICPGIVTNVTNFGAFVDIGVHQDGLVHISVLSNKFVDDPKKVVHPGDQVTVKVIKVDTEKNQISLAMNLGGGQSQKAKGEFGSDRKAKSGFKGKGPRRGSKGGQKRSDRPGSQQRSRGERKPAKPFNNPFAALQNISGDDDR